MRLSLPKLMMGFAVAAVAGGIAMAVPGTPQQADFAAHKAEVAAKRAATPRTTVNRAPQMRAPIAPNGKQLYGICYYYDYSESLSSWGPVSIDSGANHKKFGNTAFNYQSINGVYFDDKYLSIEQGTNTVWRIYNATSWQLLSTVQYTTSSDNTLPYALTWDPQTGNVYGCFFEHSVNYLNETDAHFCKVNFDDIYNPTEVIGDLGVRMLAIAADGDGVIYGIGADGNLYTINKLNGEKTLVGALSFSRSDAFQTWNTRLNSAVCDWDTGLIYYSYIDMDDDNFIATIDPKTLAVNYVGDYSYFNGTGTETSEIFTGLWFVQTPAAGESGTPADVEDLAIKAIGTSLSASATFTLPAEDTDGNALSGQLSWSITDGSTVRASGTGNPGTAVTATVPVAAAAKYNFALTVSNGSAEGKPSLVTLFVGPDTPVLEQRPVSQANSTKTSATIYLPEVYSLNGGNLDPVKFNIKRLPDNVMVATAFTGDEYEDTPASTEKKVYNYEVTPIAGTVAGEAMATRDLILGTHHAIPFFEDFSNVAFFNDYDVIDANKDNNSWWYHTSFKCPAISGSNGPNDDYLLIGPFEFTKGYEYIFTMRAEGHSNNETVEVYVGTDPQNASSFLPNRIIASTNVNPYVGASTPMGSYVAPESGKYWFGIRCTSTNGTVLYIKQCTVSAISDANPGNATNLSLTPTQNSITVSGTLPTKTIGGAKANVTSAIISRNGTELATLTEGISDGATFSYTDNNPGAGTVTYKVVAVNAAGRGREASIEGWAGLDIPGTPSNLHVYEDLNTPGLMHMSWDAPTVGARGGYINPDEITYMMEYSTSTAGASTYTMGRETEYSFSLGTPNKQGYVAVSVWGSNTAGNDRGTWVTQTAYYGPALELPLRESWSDYKQHSGMWVSQKIFPGNELFESWWEFNDGAITGKEAQDHDNGMLLVSTTKAGRGKRILSPRVTLEGAVNPVLSFYYLYTAACSELRVEIIVDDKPIKTLQQLPLAATGVKTWKRVEIPLTEYKGCKYMQIAFVGIASTPEEEFAAIDNLSIADIIENDLQAVSLTGPQSAPINEPLNLELTVRNNHSAKMTAASYNITLFKNGAECATVNGADINADAVKKFTLTDTPAVTDPEISTYHAVINCTVDGDKRNNTSAAVAVRLITPEFPTVTNVKGRAEGDNFILSWDDPDAADMPDEPVTETFDTYEAFLTENFGDWKTYDGDGKATVITATALGELNYPHIGEPMAWQIIDPDAANFIGLAWFAQSGKQMLCSFQACLDNKRDTPSNDWLISPRLNGREQTISFVATAGMGGSYAPELIDVMISKTGDNVSDFQVLNENVEIAYMPGEWGEYRFHLPAGTRYFAIVHKSTSKFALLLDNLTYTPAGSSSLNLQLMGFNVYRDLTRMNTEPLADNEYTDPNIPFGERHIYHVSAVWDKGESPLSRAFNLTMGALDGIGTVDITVTPGVGSFTVEGAEGQTVAVYDLYGRMLSVQRVFGDATVTVPSQGIYVVRIGSKTFKLQIR